MLEEQNIIADAVGRLGTQEVTRLGMQEGDMRTLADFIKGAVLENRDVKGDVVRFRKAFRLMYTL